MIMETTIQHQDAIVDEKLSVLVEDEWMSFSCAHYFSSLFSSPPLPRDSPNCWFFHGRTPDPPHVFSFFFFLALHTFGREAETG